ncbi:ankyrin repeat protein [Pyronema domesticum]|uniref:Similar to Ankyrin repeat-containing protein P1E11.10 acc. no. Q9UU77 n=1 Tax=Pyronema omphalodes (strain CBS 100304) TaxID=1076935 RepID=U4LG90_PYROM|nr:ankyrin repeat protein [Pyronema domesticum]CCX31129.1 Similar to Ankyrin repeat-containing protein P1E11.10; acc. no. Q9UU77 [Pyronema omphalodes CBS 100304]
MPSNNIWIAASDNDVASVNAFLVADASLVNSKDENGYTALHAAASYNHLDLLRSLVNIHGGNANIQDDDGDTPLFVCETVEAAQCLVEELGADVEHRNEEGKTAAEAIEEDGSCPLVAAYLRSKMAAAELPPPPAGVKVNYSTQVEDESLPVLDEALKARIEEFAQREDINSAEAQAELRDLVMGALGGNAEQLEEVKRARQ